MSQSAGDLGNAGAYIFAIVALGAGLLLGSGLVAERVKAHSVLQSIASAFDHDGEPKPTRLSIMVDNAREIRAALAKPIPPHEPLSPITAKLAYGHLKNGRATAMVAKAPKRPAAASDAMASINTGRSAAVQVELHRIY